MRLTLTGALFFATSCIASAQPATAPVAFEVASIKPAPPPTDGRIMVRMGSDAGRLTFTNVSLMNVIASAYKVKEVQISGPAWLGTERFDITAKIPDGAPKDQIPAMLQTLLADRFKMTFHKEPKVLPTYALLTAKGGPKLQPSETGGSLRMMMGPKGRHMTGKASMQQFADSLSNGLDRPVLDMTELKGNYEIDLEWSGDDAPRGMMGLPRGPGGPEGGPRPEGAPRPESHDESADAPSIFTALQDKLGLRLDPRKAPVDLIVIDHAEKVPTEN